MEWVKKSQTLCVDHVRKAVPIFTSRNISRGACLSYNHPLTTTGITNRYSPIWSEHPRPYQHLQVSYAQHADMTANTVSSRQHFERACIQTNSGHQDQAGMLTTYFGTILLPSWIPFYEMLSSTASFAFYPLSILATELRYSTPCDTPQFHMRALLPVSIHYPLFLPGCSGFPVSSHNELPDVSWPILGQHWTRAALQIFPILFLNRNFRKHLKCSSGLLWQASMQVLNPLILLLHLLSKRMHSPACLHILSSALSTSRVALYHSLFLVLAFTRAGPWTSMLECSPFLSWYSTIM